jgi:hypothetical protein
MTRFARRPERNLGSTKSFDSWENTTCKVFTDFDRRSGAHEMRPNMSRGSYSMEKFHNALDNLIGIGSVQYRLSQALFATHSLIRHDLADDEAFPTSETFKKFVELADKLTGRPASGDEGTIQATCMALSDQEADRYSHEFLALYFEIERAFFYPD